MVPGGRFRSIGKAVGLAAGALLLSSCIVGETDGARMVSNTSATLEGRLGSTGDDQGTYWFEYGATTAYGQSTPRSTSAVVRGQWAHVSQEVTDLEPGTTYHFRLCGRSSGDQGICGPDKTVTTGVARGRVRGSGGSSSPGPYPRSRRRARACPSTSSAISTAVPTSRETCPICPSSRGHH